MPNIDARAIQQRMNEITGELSGGGFAVDVLGRGDRELARARRNVLEREYAALAAGLPPTGCRAGVLEINGRLGTDFAPPPPRAVGEMDDETRSDPMLRWLHETDQSWS
jgi:hypothetical protein